MEIRWVELIDIRPNSFGDVMKSHWENLIDIFEAVIRLAEDAIKVFAEEDAAVSRQREDCVVRMKAALFQLVTYDPIYLGM